MKRSFVTLKNNNGNFIVPKFSDCLLELFSKNLNSVTVGWKLENEKLIIEEDDKGCELRHSPECPFKLISKSRNDKNEITEIATNLNNNHITVATSVVIETIDKHVLLTKRAQKLRASPNVWVTPGGYLEDSETIFKAGIREVKEETGLDLTTTNMEILGLWENTYPLLLGVGTPKTHVLIVYTHVIINETHENLTSKIIPNADEVDSYCWLNTSVVSKLFNQSSTEIEHGKQFFILDEKLIPVNLDYSTMFNKWLWSQPQPYSGVNFALRKWLEKISGNRSKF